jgi:Helicase associated domain
LLLLLLLLFNSIMWEEHFEPGNRLPVFGVPKASLATTSHSTVQDSNLFIIDKPVGGMNYAIESNLSPKPIGDDFRVVAEVPVASNSGLLEHKEYFLECLEPLLKTSNTTSGIKRKSLEVINSSLDTLSSIHDAKATSAHLVGIHHAQDSDDESDMTKSLKRQRSIDTGGGIELTDQQAASWQLRYQELIVFQQQYGHCLVPHKWPVNLALSTWVKRQRYQFKLKKQGRRSTLTDDRQQALTILGFVFDSHSVIWEERFQELVEFKRVNGHTNVPSTHPNHRLSVWVQCQRRRRKLMKDNRGDPTQQQDSQAYQIKKSRAERLQQLGFVWERRKRQQQGRIMAESTYR